MKKFQITFVVALLLSSLSTFASTITFESGADDGCTACTLTNQSWNTYINPTGTDLDGASWIQANETWDVYADFSVYEIDLSSLTGGILTSLYVAFDDTLSIKIDGDTIFDSVAEGITYGWTNITDVFDYIDVTYIEAGSTLDFYVTNTGLPNQVYGPDGVIWKGTIEVPEPTMVLALGIGILAFGFRSRKSMM